MRFKTIYDMVEIFYMAGKDKDKERERERSPCGVAEKNATDTL
jgi:hypothetical protein